MAMVTKLLLLASLVGLGACGKAASKPVEANPTVATSEAPEEVISDEVPEFVGVITSRSSKVLIAEFGGRIESLTVHQGKRVKKDEVLARLDKSDIQTEIAQLTANEKGAMASAGAYGATAQAAREQANMAERLRRRGAGSRMDFVVRQAEARAAGSRSGAGAQQAAGYREQRKRLEELLPKADIRSPIDGVVMMVKAKEGEMAQKGSPIARVFDPQDLLIRFAVPKQHRAKVKLGARVQLTIEGLDRPVWATIESINQELEPPMNFTVVDADIDDSKLAPDEIRVASQGKVRLAESVKPVAKTPPQTSNVHP